VGHTGFAHECHPAQKERLLAQEMAASARFPLAKLPIWPRLDLNASVIRTSAQISLNY
jgi:hypothetical protein